MTRTVSAAAPDAEAYLVDLLLYLGAFALAFVSVAASLTPIVALALVFVLPEPFDRPQNDNPSGAVR